MKYRNNDKVLVVMTIEEIDPDGFVILKSGNDEITLDTDRIFALVSRAKKPKPAPVEGRDYFSGAEMQLVASYRAQVEKPANPWRPASEPPGQIRNVETLGPGGVKSGWFSDTNENWYAGQNLITVYFWRELGG